jgi:hypothetical protein
VRVDGDTADVGSGRHRVIHDAAGFECFEAGFEFSDTTTNLIAITRRW